MRNMTIRMKKIICLESEQLSYSMVRKNVFSEQDLHLVNQTIKRIEQTAKLKVIGIKRL